MVKRYTAPNEKLINLNERNSNYFATLDNAKGFVIEIDKESRKYLLSHCRADAGCSKLYNTFRFCGCFIRIPKWHGRRNS
jgi:uncharacterized protein YmfQ (DUF2313 family)